ncbi:eukaryotic translation initiation factor 3 subunit E [Perkinsela sp. CCAP 1560/4]|nr:eukaryotic translation initiation factor 3 subunit E [Perkinsela sp. CCAP 1560/4]|eukprot:KNH09275.1 eukaryotic translation initiation factor 3 subunit E [Perkinsela sp. CCAP 1560/4]
MELPYDLTDTTLSYVDRHLAITLLDTMQTNKSPYSEKSLLHAQYKLCTGTQLYSDLIDLAEDVVPEEKLSDAQSEYKLKQEALAAERDRLLLGEGVSKYKAFLSTEENKVRYQKMCDDTSIATRGLEVFELKDDNLKEIFHFAQSVYQYGQYGECRSILRFLAFVKPSQYRYDEKRMWGQLACEILCAKHGDEGVKWQDAIRSLNAIMDSLEHVKRPVFTTIRCLHWGLFTHLLSGVPQGRDQLIELFLNEKNFSIIFSHAQHLLRYVLVCLMTTRTLWLRGNAHGHPMVRELVQVLKDINFEYSDPIVEMFSALFIMCDTKRAIDVLASAVTTVRNDVFLKPYAEEFLETARRQIFEDYCKTHGRVSLRHIATSIGIASEEAEKWVVNVLRNSKMNGRIHEENGNVFVVTERQTIALSEAITEKSSAIVTRLQSLVNCHM